MSLIEEALRKQQLQQQQQQQQEGKTEADKPAERKVVRISPAAAVKPAAPSPGRIRLTAPQPGKDAPQPKKELTLKRSEPQKPVEKPAESEAISPPPTPLPVTPPPVPAEEPDDAVAEPEPSEDDDLDVQADDRQPASRTKLLVLALLLLIGVAWGGWTIWQRMFIETPPSQPASPPVASIDAQPTAPPVSEPEPVSPPVQTDTITELPAEPSPEPDVEITEPAPQPQPDVASVPEPAPQPEPERIPEPEPEPVRVPVIWPALHLTGTLDIGGGEGAAFLNGEVIGVGERLMGVTVVEVTRRGITLRKDGEERFLAVGSILQ